ncbi:MAG: hypothetical protein GXO74_08700 [Calditrichaeota bacterium]|nr:hypothetical protein [Calditrichota bacterium]
MKKFALVPILLIILALVIGCSQAEKIFKTIDKSKLAPPLGLRSVTGDEQVTLFWYTSNYEDDFGGYYVFFAIGDFTSQSSDTSLSVVFSKIDSLSFNQPSDNLVSTTLTNLTNGQTYSFAVVAYQKDKKNEISYPSNVIKDTPRDEIYSVTLKSASTGQVSGDDSQAGFDFDSFSVVDVPQVGYTSTNGSDIINEAFDPSNAGNIRPWLAGMNSAGIQDLGYMADLDGSDVAPEMGYSEEGKSIAVILGHVYAVKTGDNKYGKMIITNIGNENDGYSITFNAAFQTQDGNRNYKVLDWGHQLGIY